MEQTNEIMKLAEKIKENAEDSKSVRELAEELLMTSKREPKDLCIKTPLGTLHAYRSVDEEYPGIYIDLKKDGNPVEAPLILLEYSRTENLEFGLQMKPSIILRSWDDVCKEDYSTRVCFEGLDQYFSEVSKK